MFIHRIFRELYCKFQWNAGAEYPLPTSNNVLAVCNDANFPVMVESAYCACNGSRVFPFQYPKFNMFPPVVICISFENESYRFITSRSFRLNADRNNLNRLVKSNNK